MKIWFLRVMVWLSLRLRVYYAWSKVYQWLYEKRKWERVDIPSYSTLAEIEKITGDMEWRKDGLREFGDAISMPQAAYGKHLKGEAAGDCDEISSFAAFCIARLRLYAELEKPITDVGLLSSPWIRAGKLGGHNVCAFAYSDTGGTKWAYISNWFNGRIQWDFDCKEDIVKHMLGSTGTSLGWAFARAAIVQTGYNYHKTRMELKPTEYHWNVKGI